MSLEREQEIPQSPKSPLEPELEASFGRDAACLPEQIPEDHFSWDLGITFPTPQPESAGTLILNFPATRTGRK